MQHFKHTAHSLQEEALRWNFKQHTVTIVQHQSFVYIDHSGGCLLVVSIVIHLVENSSPHVPHGRFQAETRVQMNSHIKDPAVLKVYILIYLDC